MEQQIDKEYHIIIKYTDATGKIVRTQEIFSHRRSIVIDWLKDK
jgi:hypothetical protein